MLSPEEAKIYSKSAIQKAVKEGLSSIYPLVSKNRTLSLDGVEFKDTELSPESKADIKNATLNKKTIGSDVIAKFTLKDTEGDVVAKHKIQLGTVPYMAKTTQSFIVNGTHYSMPIQERLRTGGYGRLNANNEAEVFINIDGRGPMRTQINPEKKTISFKIGQGNVSAYRLLKILGKKDSEIKKTVGEEIFTAMSKDKEIPSTNKIYKAIFHKPAENVDIAANEIREHFQSLSVDPEINKKHFGHEYRDVDGDFLLATTKKVIDITKDRKEDNRDAPANKIFLAPADFLKDSLERYGKSNVGIYKSKTSMDKHDTISKVVDKRGLSKVIEGVFTTSALSRYADQHNPVGMLTAPFLSTLLGDGGINSSTAVSDTAKHLQNSHAGVKDPTLTPESHSAGITTTIANGARKKGDTLEVLVTDIVKNTKEYKSIRDLEKEILAFPEEFVQKNGKWKPLNKKAIVVQNNKLKTVRPMDVRYMLSSPDNMFSTATNVVPFLDSNQGNRMLTGGKMVQQAISVEDPDVSPVDLQVDGKSIWEEIGSKYSLSSDKKGVVDKITKKNITVNNYDGTRSKYELFNNMPLNDHAILIDKIKVKVGDKVNKGQILSDSNFTKDGKYAIGKNLRVALIPFNGENYEDSIVITEGAAKKLSSFHSHLKEQSIYDDSVFDLNKFKGISPYAIKGKDLSRYDADGVVKQGTILRPDDIVIASLRKNSLSGAESIMERLKRNSSDKYKDSSVKWDNEFTGEVTDVVKTDKDVKVFIKTLEPFKVGDKLTNAHGAKGIVGKIIKDELAPTIVETGEKVEMIVDPHGVAPRINIGQILELNAGELFHRTGKRMKVENFKNNFYAKKILDEFKKNGIPEKRKIYNPADGKTIEVSTGIQNILKLKQQIDKGISTRGVDGAYSQNRQPSSGGGKGGQSLDKLTWNALLAHNARNFVRETFSLKNNPNDAYWRAVQHGEVPPPPETPFEFKKFKGLLQAQGINTINTGTALKLAPLTDKELLKISNGAIGNVMKTFKGKRNDLSPSPDGIFGYNTGGLQGQKTNHIELEERIISPAYRSAVKSILHLTDKEFEEQL